MPLAEVNIVICLPTILSRMSLVEANLVIHLPAILSRMPLAEANLVNTLDFIYIEHNIYCNCIHHKNFKLYKCKKEGKSHTCSACLVTSPNRRSNPGCSSWITRKFLVIVPSSRYYREFIFIHYSYVTSYACSFPQNNKHIYIYISCIFSKLVSQCASVRMTQFFYILTYNIHVKVYCYYLTLNCYCPTIVVQPLLSRHWTVTVQSLLSRHWTVIVQLLLSRHWTVTVWTLIRFFTISRVLELHFKWDWFRWKAKTRGYKFSKGRRTQFCLQDSQNFSSTNQSYYPTESVTTQSRLVTHNWSSASPNWAIPIFLVS